MSGHTPELLDALKLIDTAVERGFGAAYMQGVARAAISKATGGTP